MKNTARSMKQKTGLLTHEQFIAEVANAAISLVPHEERSDLLNAKLTYGAGKSGLRGITYYDKWLTSDDEKAAFVEICSFGESSPVQLAGTTIHELGHVLAGFKAGHSKQWKCACEGLGLRRLQAAGTEYKLAMFHPDIRATIVSLIERLEPAKPGQGHFAPTGPQKPCSAGTGSRGGVSRGVGSGSRLRKYVCACTPPQIIRASTDTLDCTCNKCASSFTQPATAA
jgi:hypothetical protein